VGGENPLSRFWDRVFPTPGGPSSKKFCAPKFGLKRGLFWAKGPLTNSYPGKIAPPLYGRHFMETLWEIAPDKGNSPRESLGPLGKEEFPLVGDPCLYKTRRALRAREAPPPTFVIGVSKMHVVPASSLIAAYAAPTLTERLMDRWNQVAQLSNNCIMLLGRIK